MTRSPEPRLCQGEPRLCKFGMIAGEALYCVSYTLCPCMHVTTLESRLVWDLWAHRTASGIDPQTFRGEKALYTRKLLLHVTSFFFSFSSPTSLEYHVFWTFFLCISYLHPVYWKVSVGSLLFSVTSLCVTLLYNSFLMYWLNVNVFWPFFTF